MNESEESKSGCGENNVAVIQASPVFWNGDVVEEVEKAT